MAGAHQRPQLGGAARRPLRTPHADPRGGLLGDADPKAKVDAVPHQPRQVVSGRLDTRSMAEALLGAPLAGRCRARPCSKRSR